MVMIMQTYVHISPLCFGISAAVGHPILILRSALLERLQNNQCTMALMKVDTTVMWKETVHVRSEIEQLGRNKAQSGLQYP